MPSNNLRARIKLLQKPLIEMYSCHNLENLKLLLNMPTGVIKEQRIKLRVCKITIRTL